MSNFQSKTALIIGGTSGIGRATAEELLKLVKHQVDITDRSAVKGLVTTIGQLSNLDYLVNASGIFGPKPFLDHTVEDYDSYLDLNRGFFFISQAAARAMIKSGGGSIVNVGSMWAKQAVKATPSSAYSMQKAGLHSLTQHLAMELAEHKIRVNAVSPAVVDTPVYHAVFGGVAEAKEALEGLNGFHPIGRNGTANEIAQSILFLLSDDSSWVTGSIMDIDGGVMAGRN